MGGACGDTQVGNYPADEVRSIGLGAYILHLTHFRTHSTLLKSDQWHQDAEYVPNPVRGAVSFRNVPGTTIYACGQPTEAAIDEVVLRVRNDFPDTDHLVWICLREEPIVVINGSPYCLRRESFSLRNMKARLVLFRSEQRLTSQQDYGGIASSRLEVLEERLKDDVIAEIRAFGGRVLLHNEPSEGGVVPIWEDALEKDVAVLREVFNSKKDTNGIRLHYSRVPITSETPPDFTE